MTKAIFYRCEKCGNIVMMVHVGGGELVCCGQPMTKLLENSTDGSIEKHVPFLKHEGTKIKVSVGSAPHSMTPEHYIEWVAMISGKKRELYYLKPGEEPAAEFDYSPGMDEVIFTGDSDEIVPNCEGNICNFVETKHPKPVTVYAYCNLHGLWKAEL